MRVFKNPGSHRLAGLLLSVLVTAILIGLPVKGHCEDTTVSPITNEFLQKMLGEELNNPRLMSEADIGDAKERANYRKEGWSFVVTGDFNFDGKTDYAVVGKHDGLYKDESVFVAVFEEKAGRFSKKYLYQLVNPHDRAFLRKEAAANLKAPGIDSRSDVIIVGLALYTDYTFSVVWDGKKFRKAGSFAYW